MFLFSIMKRVMLLMNPVASFFWRSYFTHIDILQLIANIIWLTSFV